MSEASNVWRVGLDGHEHEIEIEHSTWTGKATVTVDGGRAGEARLLFRRKPIEFDVEGHPAKVTLDFKYGGFGAASALHLDGRYVEPLRR